MQAAPATAEKNTTMHTPAVTSGVEGRLQALAQADSTAAAFIREAALSCPPQDPVHARSRDASPQVGSWLDALEETPDVVIMPGSGRHNEVEALLQLLPEDCRLVILEKDLDRAAALFARLEIEDLISAGRVRVAFGDNRRRIDEQVMAVLDVPNKPAISIFPLSEASEDDSRFYCEALLAFRDYMRGYMLNIGTLMMRGVLWQQNSIRNLPVIIDNPDMSALDDLFDGVPALVVAAGPSLDDALVHIAAVKDHYIIISVGQALGPLHAAGIRPDLVVSVDALKCTEEQFKAPCDDLYLVASCVAWPGVVNRFKGVFTGYCTANPAGRWIKEAAGVPGKPLNAAGTVTATALDLARRMGCDTIVTAGLDLAMGNNRKSHANHTQYHGQQQDEAKLFPVPGNTQETVLTRMDYRVYIDRIGEYVQAHPDTRFINANNGGARIDGMEVAPLEQIRDFAGPFVDAYGAIAATHQSFSIAPATRERVREQIDKVAAQLSEIITDSTTAAMLCNQLIIMLKMPGPGSEAIAREHLETLKQIDARLLAARELSALVEMCLRPVYYSMGMHATGHDESYSAAIYANMQSRRLYEHTAAATWKTRKALLECFENDKQQTGDSP